MKPNLILIRHGQSQYNLQNRFAGWVDTPLTREGVAQAKAAGELLKLARFVPDRVFVSPMTRTLQTAAEMARIIGVSEALMSEDARLVERSYGALSGKNKDEAKAEYGEEKFRQIRRGYATQPPPLTDDHPLFHEILDTFRAKLRGSFSAACPMTESLKDVVVRVLPFSDEVLAPMLSAGARVLIVAHGNSLRALIKILKGLSDEEINKVEMETAQPAAFDVAVKEGRNYVVREDTLGKDSESVKKALLSLA